jgi:hypothetical protein
MAKGTGSTSIGSAQKGTGSRYRSARSAISYQNGKDYSKQDGVVGIDLGL